MASVALSSKAVGSIVKIKVNGTLRDFIVVQQGKPSSIRRVLQWHMVVDERPVRKPPVA